MLAFTLKRLAATLLVLVTVSVLAFGFVHLSGDPAVAMAGEQASQQDLAAIRAQFGYDQPIVTQYLHWLTKVLHGNLGYSYYLKRDAAGVLLQRLPVTLLLGGGGMVVALVMALPLGILSAVFRNSWIDRCAMALSVVGQSLPNFMVGFMLMWFFGVYLRWLPIGGNQHFVNYISPMLALGLYAMPPLLRLVRAEMIGTVGSDYVKMARAKGMGSWNLVMHQALRNALAPVVSLAAVQLGHLLGGAVVIEAIFSIQGLGNLAWQSIQRSDLEMMQALILLMALMYSLLTLVADLLNGVLNPRLRRQ